MSDFDDEPIDEAIDEVSDLDDAPPARKPKKAPAPDPDDDWDDDWDDDERSGRRDLTLVYVVVAAAVVIVLAIVLTRPKDDNSTTNAGGTGTTAGAPIVKNWQGAVGDAVGKNGADAQARATKAAGVTIWTDFFGWHVRLNLDTDVVVTVTAPQVREKVTDNYDDDDEKGNAPFTTEASVTIKAGDPSSGPGFDLGNSESATFAITVDGKDIPASQILLGGAQGVADSSPVQFTKS